MGLLDDLRNQADNQRVNEAADAERQAKLEAYYEEAMRPRMIKAFQYLTEFVKHLNYIKLETFVEYPLLPNGELQRLQQQDYKVVIDSSKALKEIKFTMECVLVSAEPVEFDVFGKDAVLLQVDKIKRYSFRHECKTRSLNMEITSAKFTLEGPLPLAVNINADINESKIKIEIRNFNEPGYAKYVLTAEEFNDEFLDRLAKFVIRQERTLFGGEEISDAAKKVLRDKLIVERRIRAQEMLEVEAKIRAEEAAASERSTREQLKRAVNTKVAKGKESLKDMFGKLKKQAGFDSVTKDTTSVQTTNAAPKAEQPVRVPATTAAPKAEQPVRVPATTAAPKAEQPARVPATTAAPKAEQPARVPATTAAPKAEQPARVPATTAVPKTEQPARGQATTAVPKAGQPARGQATTAAPKAEQPARGQATTAASKSKQQAPTQAAMATQKPQTPVTQTSASSDPQKQEPVAPPAKKSQSPKVYTAPNGNPFLTPEEPAPSSEQVNDFDSKLNQKKYKVGEKSNFNIEDAKTSSSKSSLSPEDLENDLVNIMQRDTPTKLEVKPVHESAGKVDSKATARPESKLELNLEHEATKEPAPGIKVEQKPAPGLVEPKATARPESKLELDLEHHTTKEPESGIKVEQKPAPGLVEPKATARPEPKFELDLENEPTREPEPGTKVEQKPAPDLVEPDTTARSESKLELVLENEATKEPEPETKVEQKPDSNITELKIEPTSKPASDSNPELELKIEKSKETLPSKPSLASEGPDIDLSAPSSIVQEEKEPDTPLTSMFPRSNKKPEE